MEEEQKEGKPESFIDWHNALPATLHMELEIDIDSLLIETELSLTAKPLRIDIMVIKKTKELVITSNIGKLFRGYNIFEYKSPEDYISISSFYRAYSYVWVYISEHPEVRASDITLTFLTQSMPRKLMDYLRHENNYSITKKYDGIYYIVGDQIPIQIIVSKKLSKEKNVWLHSLDNKVTSEELNVLVQEARKREYNYGLEAYIDIVLKNNKHLVEEAKDMPFSKETDFLIEDLLIEWSKRGYVPPLFQEKIDQAKDEVDRAKNEADRAKNEAEQIRRDSVRALKNSGYSDDMISGTLKISIGAVQMLLAD
jgi:hypothetical protein